MYFAVPRAREFVWWEQWCFSTLGFSPAAFLSHVTTLQLLRRRFPLESFGQLSGVASRVLPLSGEERGQCDTADAASSRIWTSVWHSFGRTCGCVQPSLTGVSRLLILAAPAKRGVSAGVENLQVLRVFRAFPCASREISKFVRSPGLLLVYDFHRKVATDVINFLYGFFEEFWKRTFIMFLGSIWPGLLLCWHISGFEKWTFLVSMACLTY